MGACGGAHHWARTLQTLGHEVKPCARQMFAPLCCPRLTPVMPRAIWVAAQQPQHQGRCHKNEQQQACSTLHRMRAQLMKVRII